MHYKVEFICWRGATSADAEVVGRLDGPFDCKDEAFAQAEPLVSQFRLKGATAFRIFEENKSPVPARAGRFAFVKI